MGRPRPSLSADGWSHETHDPDIGPIRLTGHLGSTGLGGTDPGSTDLGGTGLLIVVHGLGGSANSLYISRAVRVAEALGLATLCFNLRGSDRSGVDLYHAGLTSDLASILTSPSLAFAEDIYILGYSLGGHVGLKFATEVVDPRVRAVAAVCSPLDLDRTVQVFDRPSRLPYRRYVLSGLYEIYDQVAQLRDVPVAPEEVRRSRTLREFDRLVIVPRFGFDSVEDYYQQAGVGSRLGDLRVPSLLVAAEGDPMVDADGIRHVLGSVPRSDTKKLDVCWTHRGGHVSFPANLDLGLKAPLGLESQVLSWLVGKT